jgi:D-glycero-D-manno-heptose 1,7-bisphosphate phosphatase
MHIHHKKIINQCVILCGGYGSRIYPLTKNTPKPLIKYFKKPFLFYLIDSLRDQGFRKILILTYYKSNKFNKKLFKNYKELEITIIKEKYKLGTGGSIINSKKYLENYFFVINGDTYFDINLRSFEKKFKKNYLALLALKKNFFFKQDIQIKKIKKEFFNSESKIFNGGVYILNKKILNCNRRGNLDLDKDIIIPHLNKKKIYGQIYLNRFTDIGKNLPSFIKSKAILKKIIYKPCCFLDRDGVINYDYGYVFNKKKFKWRPGVQEGIKILNDNGYYVIVVTNQSGIGRGYYSKKKVNDLHTYINLELNKNGAFINNFYFSPYHPQAKIRKYKRISNCRKPGIGMFLQAIKDYKILKKNSFFIGDSKSDLMAAKNFKIPFFYPDINFKEQIKKIINIS